MPVGFGQEPLWAVNFTNQTRMQDLFEKIAVTVIFFF
jgi:hypothetical protein